MGDIKNVILATVFTYWRLAATLTALAVGFFVGIMVL